MQHKYVPSETTDYSLLVNCRVKLTGTPLVPKMTILVLKLSRSSGSLCQDHPACCVLITSSYFCVNTLFGTLGGTTIVMAVHNSKDIIMVSYEDLPAEDKDVIGKAIEEF